MARFIVSKPAANDVNEIVAWIRRDNRSAATRVRAELRKAMTLLASFPYMGHERRDLTDQALRFWTVYSYLIVYDPEKRPIEIVRVIHGARDVERILRR